MPTKIAEENKKLNDSERDSQITILKSMPQRIVFETTNRCNLRCQMCGQSHRKFTGIDMSVETFKKTEPFWPAVYDVSLFGWGEPLLNAHLGGFFDMIIAHKPRVFVLTNGLLLKDNMIERFVKGGLAFLNFSFDGVTAETYNKIRRGSDFNKVLSNIKKVVEVKRREKKDTPYLRMVFVGMAQNIKELPRFVELAAELGMDEAKMVYMIAYGEDMKEEALFYHKELTNNMLDEAERRAKELGIKLNIPDRFTISNDDAKSTVSEKHKFCCRPWEELFVQSDGKVRLCMLSKEIMGDLHKEDVIDIWNNERFQFFREWVNSKTPPGTCAHCPQYREMNINDIDAFVQVATELPGTEEAVKC